MEKEYGLLIMEENNDEIYAVQVDDEDNIYLGGQTASTISKYI
jgi:hypothetical protein